MSLYSPAGFIFIHNPKSGGTTVRNLLQCPLVRYLTAPHDPALTVMRHMKHIGAEGHWNLAFKFAFIRNPYTWVESMRRHCVAQEDHPLHWVSGQPESFPHWLATHCTRMTRTANGPICFQRDMVMGYNGELLLDRLCRFENYKDEVEWLCEHLGYVCPEEIPATGLTEAPTIEISGGYRERIAEYFAEDFKAFNYEL